MADGFCTHNSINELSARYRELPEEFYVPSPSQIGKQSKDNKQMRVYAKENLEASGTIKLACEASFLVYKTLLKQGVPRELARVVLPFGTYSHMFTTFNLLNLMKFMSLRTHEHAQPEIRVFADAMVDLASSVAPVAMSVWKAGENS